MIIDSHSTIFPDGPLADAIEEAKPGFKQALGHAGLSDVLARASAAGIDASVTWLLATTPEMAVRANDFVASLARDHPGRFIPVATVDPHDTPRALAELARCVEERDFRGLKIHPIVQDCPIDDPGVLALVKRAAEYGIPVVFHVNPPRAAGQSSFANPHANAEAWRLRAALEIYDSERLISAHMGGVFDRDIAESRCSFQTTGATTDTISDALQEVGADRVMFGSDYPFYAIDDELQKVLDLDVSEADRDAILAGNAQRVFARPNERPGIPDG